MERGKERADVETLIAASEFLGSREQVAEALSELPLDLSNQTIVVSFDFNRSSRPSFVDELVKEVLIIRGARELNLQNAPRAVQEFALRSAISRQVGDQLTFSDSAGHSMIASERPIPSLKPSP